MGGGIGAIVMALIAVFVFNGDPSDVLNQLGQSQNQSQIQDAPARPQTPREKEIDDFILGIKGSTEDVWTQIFRENGKKYRPPKLINYDHTTPTGTNLVADARMGPFYLPVKETIFIDTAFFRQMDRELGGGGDFAYAYVIAHEVGHHIQKLAGKTDYVHGKKGRISESSYNRLSVRLELQADFYAGVWAHHANKQHREIHGVDLLEEGDIEEALNSAKAIGDDTLQRGAGRRVQPETFSHGTSGQRMRWFIKGIRSGNILEGNTFDVPYSDL